MRAAVAAHSPRSGINGLCRQARGARRTMASRHGPRPVSRAARPVGRMSRRGPDRKTVLNLGIPPSLGSAFAQFCSFHYPPWFGQLPDKLPEAQVYPVKICINSHPLAELAGRPGDAISLAVGSLQDRGRRLVKYFPLCQDRWSKLGEAKKIDSTRAAAAAAANIAGGRRGDGLAAVAPAGRRRKAAPSRFPALR